MFRVKLQGRAGKLFLAGIAVLFAAIPELAYWFGCLYSDSLPKNGTCAVLVLGFPTRKDGSLHPMQRARVSAGVGAFREGHCERMVLAGGAAHSPYIEAETMARFAMSLGIPQGNLVLEKRSRTTRENILYSLPYLEQMDHIILVSDTLHVHRAKRYFCHMRSLSCPKVYTYTWYRPFDLYGMKLVGAPYEFWAWIKEGWGEGRSH